MVEDSGSRCHGGQALDFASIWTRCLMTRGLYIQVTEEIVLTDSTGLHTGGGPYLLLYSRAVDHDMESTEDWPESVKVSPQLCLLSDETACEANTLNQHRWISCSITPRFEKLSPPKW